MNAIERLLKYVKINTQSDENSETMPSASNVFQLANMLKEELESLGASDVYLDENTACTYAVIPATKGYEDKPKIGFIAHMDTSPDFSGEGVNVQIIENYDGCDVKLGNSGRVLKVSDFPHLPSLAGRTLVTTDGTTLLGADDKAGVAVIMTMVEKIIKENIPHGKICIGFTPDEEVGRGTDGFDIERFGADFAYTVDGSCEGEIEYENFNAASATLEFSGNNVHPGSAKNIMINAAKVAMELDSMLPWADTPDKTDGYEGFYHLIGIQGDVERANSAYIIRDHDADMFESRKRTISHSVKALNEKYGENTVKLTIKDSYYNMAPKLADCMHLIDNAREVILSLGLKPATNPIRGGTDGARLTYMGLPCPNLGTGGYAFHGPYEHITAEGIALATDIVVGIVKQYAK